MKPSSSSTLRSCSPANETARPLPEEGAISPFARRIVGVVGLGRMGEAFALNLVADGHRVLVFDRDPARVAAVGQFGAEAVPELGDLAACDVVVTSLPDDDARGWGELDWSALGLLAARDAGLDALADKTVHRP